MASTQLMLVSFHPQVPKHTQVLLHGFICGDCLSTVSPPGVLQPIPQPRETRSTWEACPRPLKSTLIRTFLLTELLTLGSLLPPPPGRIQHQVIYLPYSSHISPLVHIPNATSLTSATLVPTLPLQWSSPNGQLPSLPFPQTLQWLPSMVHQTLWALLCPQPHNIAHVFCPLGSSHTGLRNTLPPPTSGLLHILFLPPGPSFCTPSPPIKLLQILRSVSDTPTTTKSRSPTTCLQSTLLPPLNPYHSL